MKDVTKIGFNKSLYHPVLPLVYDDALSYIEQLGKFAVKINEVIDMFGELELEILTQANEYTDVQISERLKDVDEALVEFRTLARELGEAFDELEERVDSDIEEVRTDVADFDVKLVASIESVNKRTDEVVKENNDYLLNEMQKFLANILVSNYITGEEMSIQDMFDYLCKFHLPNSLTYAELVDRDKTYAELVAYNMTYTQLVTEGKVIII